MPKQTDSAAAVEQAIVALLIRVNDEADLADPENAARWQLVGQHLEHAKGRVSEVVEPA